MRAQKNSNKGACAGLRGYQEVMGEGGEKRLKGLKGKSKLECQRLVQCFLITMMWHSEGNVSASVNESASQ